jgi:hypothetical protein
MRFLLRPESLWKRRWQPLVLMVFALCALAPLAVYHAQAGIASSKSLSAFEWPQQLDGKPLRPMALGAVENRFAQQFPGRIGKFSTEDEAVTLRTVDRPTRMLHPATDCYRGLGYRILDSRLERDSKGRLWRCFTAWRDGVAYRVCERIEAADGQGFTDTSAWFWSAALEKSAGPWLAITKAERL